MQGRVLGSGAFFLAPISVSLALQFPLLTPGRTWVLRKVEPWPADSRPAPGIFDKAAHERWPNPGEGARYCLGRRK